MHTLVLATHNAHKADELQQLLSPHDVNVVPLSPQCAIPDENASTFVGNALIKAQAAAQWAQEAFPGSWILADDSGLVVPALGGQPGVHSARFAHAQASDAENRAHLLTLMQDRDDAERHAFFVSVLVVLRTAQDPCPLIAQGFWHGCVLHQEQGDNGFGYDPIFGVPELNCSVAELSPETKHALSHRGQALRRLIAQWPR